MEKGFLLGLGYLNTFLIYRGSDEKAYLRCSNIKQVSLSGKHLLGIGLKYRKGIPNML